MFGSNATSLTTALSNKANTSDLSNYLPKASGTGSGNFNISGYTTANNSFYINQPSTNPNTGLKSGHAYLGVRDGTINSSNKSAIYLRSADTGEKNFTATDTAGNAISLFTVTPTNTVSSTVFGRPYTDASNTSENAYIRCYNVYKDTVTQLTATVGGNTQLQMKDGTGSWRTPIQYDSSGKLSGDAVATLGTAASGSATTTSGTWKVQGYVTLSKGLWIISAQASWASNATGLRYAGLSTDGNATETNMLCSMRTTAASGNWTNYCFSWIVNVTTDSQKIYMKMLQNSGSNSLNSFYSLIPVRLRAGE